jgi:hypothetical protein
MTQIMQILKITRPRVLAIRITNITLTAIPETLANSHSTRTAMQPGIDSLKPDIQHNRGYLQ